MYRVYVPSPEDILLPINSDLLFSVKISLFFHNSISASTFTWVTTNLNTDYRQTDRVVVLLCQLITRPSHWSIAALLDSDWWTGEVKETHKDTVLPYVLFNQRGQDVQSANVLFLNCERVLKS